LWKKIKSKRQILIGLTLIASALFLTACNLRKDLLAKDFVSLSAQVS